MAFRFSRSDRSVEQGVRRIAVEQIDGAIAAIDGLERAAAVHDIRKRCKKLRALVRLVKPGFPQHAEENACFREIAALVSCARDTHVMLERFDGLLRHDDHGESAGAMVELRSYLASLAHQADAADLDGAMAVVRHRMVEARKRASCWHIEKDGWPALAKGLGSCLRQARKAALTAEAHPDMESFHELRKRIKDHWYHCRLLVALWPEAMAVRSKAAGELGELLGEHHDLAVLVQRLMAGCGAWGDKFRVKQVVALAEARARKLEKQAWPMIERLLAQKPAQLKAHWGRLWRAWREEGSLRERLTG